MEAHICNICSHPYNSTEKKPLVLPCSHSFCQACLQQVEAAGDKRCPTCRKDWSDVKLSDLLSCYQLIPAEDQTVKGQIDKAASEGVPQPSLCVEHSDQFIYWCESCEVPACEECMKLNHAECDYILMEDKVYISLLKDKSVHYSVQMLESKRELFNVSDLMKKLALLEKEKIDYHSKIEAWQAVAEVILSNCRKTSRVSLESPKQGSPVSNSSSFLNELEKRILHRPSPLLVHIASAYQSSKDDFEAFTSDLGKQILEENQADDACNEAALAVEVTEQAFQDAVATLTKKKEWVLSDTTSAAVLKVLHTTSTRPKNVKVIWGNMPEELVMEIQRFRNCDNHWTLDCFHHFGEPSSVTRKSTTAKLKILIESDRCGSLRQFCGHLDAVAVQQLPATIRVVGLVLREQEDMAAVNALCGAAFSNGNYNNGTDKLIWRCWTTLDLSVEKTFLPEYWQLKWNWFAYVLNQLAQIGLTLSTALPSLGVRLRIYLPQLETEDRRWMGDLFGVMALGGLRGPIPLFLPGANLDPDPLLGVLRDSGQHWEVHLPASLPQLASRNDVTERYKDHGHSVTWDLE